MTAGLTRMLAPKGAQLIPLLSEMYRNVGTRKASGLKELGEQAAPSQGQQSKGPELLPHPCGAEPRLWFTESQTPFITELHFHLHTNYFKELEKV